MTLLLKNRYEIARGLEISLYRKRKMLRGSVFLFLALFEREKKSAVAVAD